MDEDLAAEIREFRSPTDNGTRMFYEIIIAPGYTPEGLAKLKGKSKTLRILEAPLRAPSGRSLRQVAGEEPRLVAVTFSRAWPLLHDLALFQDCGCANQDLLAQLRGYAPLHKPGKSQDLYAGGWLYQHADSLTPEEIDFIPVSDTKPTEQQLEDLRFAWRIVKHVKSNAITVAKDGRLLGMGSGQPNRVKSTEIALEKAAEEAKV